MRYFRLSLSLFGILSLFTIGRTASAQNEATARTPRADTLHRELLVVSDQEVQIEQAVPLNSKFEFDKPKFTKLKPLPPRSTGDFTPPVIVPRHPVLSDLAAQVPSSDKYGYLQFSAGADPNVRLLGGYSRLLDEKHQLDIHLSHRSKQHNVPLNEKESLLKQHTSDIWLGYSRLAPKGIFSIQAQGAYDYYNYFAPNPLLLLHKPLFVSPLNVGEDYEKVQFNYRTLSTQKVNAAVDLAYEHTGLAVKREGMPFNRVEEQRVLFNTLIQSKRGNDFFIGVNFSGFVQLHSSGNMPLLYHKGSALSHAIFLSELVPHLQYSSLLGNTRWDVYVGGGMGFLTLRDQGLYFYPKISTSFTFSKYVQLFARAEGGTEAPSRYELGKVNRFIDPNHIVSPNVYALDAELGVRSYWGYGFSFDFSGGYQIASNRTFLLPNVNMAIPERTPFISFIPVYDKMDNWFLKGAISYAMGDKLQVSFSGIYNNYKTARLSVAEGLPVWSWEAEALYRWSEKLSFALRTKLHHGIRYSLTPDEQYRMQELAFSGAYRLNKSWSIHGEIKTPFFGASEYPFGYRDFYPFAGMIGATMLF